MPDVKLDDTICAMATASGEAALSIVRLSGNQAIPIADKVFSARSGKTLSEAKTFTIHYGHIVKDGNLVDECLVSVFRNPKSFTTEDMIEFSSHGGTQVAKELIALCCRYGARVAEPGEFTKRAFLNGRIDLTQAEAVIDIIKAKGDQSLRQAIHQLGGGLSEKLKGLKEKLLLVLAHVEAHIDFPEEDHAVFTNRELKTRMDEVKKDLEELVETYRSGALIRSGLLCAIVGKPNVGKSSLLNALLGQDRAIVTDIPGTTRDTLEEAVNWDGVTVRLVDTAGLGAPKDEVDQLGMDRTRKYLNQADFYLWVVDGSGVFGEEDKLVGSSLLGKPFILAINKSDLSQKFDKKTLGAQFDSANLVKCSALTGEGLEEIRRNVLERILASEKGSENVHLTRERHHQGAQDACLHLERAQDAFSEKKSLEFVASDLRGALRSLSELIGEVYSDDILDVIFREFCIGK